MRKSGTQRFHDAGIHIDLGGISDNYLPYVGINSTSDLVHSRIGLSRPLMKTIAATGVCLTRYEGERIE